MCKHLLDMLAQARVLETTKLILDLLTSNVEIIRPMRQLLVDKIDWRLYNDVVFYSYHYWRL
jgi:hypothetical protein